jgi:hypothetical protein
MEGVLAISMGIGGPVLVVFLLLYYSTKKTSKKLEALVKIVELGGNVDPSMMAMLNEPGGPTADLRKGMIWLAIGIPLTLGLLLMPGGEAPWAFGLVPVFVGIAYLVVRKIGYDDDHKESENPPG